MESINKVEIKPSKDVMNNVCSTKKICDEQGPITFGQLREMVESGKLKRIGIHVGEGGYKALLRLLPWFIPQLALLGFGATWVRVFNKIFRPALEETTNYKTWWGKTIIKIFDLVEGELNSNDPLSKIFFISDGLMTMLNDKYKIQFAQYISEVANEQNDNEIVPDYFVENELRHWVNKRFLLDPPLKPKNIKKEEDLDQELNEKHMTLTKQTIVESYKYDSLIRKIVKDIVTLYKEKGVGEYYLPEDIDENEFEYHFKDIFVTVELILEESKSVDGFLLNADYYSDDDDGEDVVIVKIVYNPETKKTKVCLTLMLNQMMKMMKKKDMIITQNQKN